MVTVVLRTGKVLKYNNGNSITIEDGAFAVRDDGLIARIPLDIVERIEFFKPCKILREKSLRRIQRYY